MLFPMELGFFMIDDEAVEAAIDLGASRWQTVWRVVLPSASPGIFAGIVIGLGRAVGETMIVLMATGNTPVMRAVKEAERRILNDQTSKAYTGLAGDPAFSRRLPASWLTNGGSP